MVDNNRIPSHVAIIMDGNGRWAQNRSMPRFFGHRQGVAALKKAVRYAANQGIETLTVYAFSTENWHRPPDEVNFLMDLMHKTFSKEIEELYREGVKIVLIGDRSTLSSDILAVWDRAEQITKNNRRMTLNVAFNYGGRTEIVAAVKNIAAKVLTGHISIDDIDDELFNEELYTSHSPDPDLLIRTGGELRLSNFLLWQSAYTEIYVTATLWPDFDEEDFEKALQSYAKRERRFGRVPVKELTK